VVVGRPNQYPNLDRLGRARFCLLQQIFDFKFLLILEGGVKMKMAFHIEEFFASIGVSGLRVVSSEAADSQGRA
jgi:hypothetical protein